MSSSKNENKRISFLNLPALIGTVGIVIACVTLYFLSGYFGWEEIWLVQILNILVGVVLVFSVFDIVTLLRAGILIRDGKVITGKGMGGVEEGFWQKDLSKIRLVSPSGAPIETGKRIYAHVLIEFVLADGRCKQYETRMMTKGQLGRLCRALGKEPWEPAPERSETINR